MGFTMRSSKRKKMSVPAEASETKTVRLSLVDWEESEARESESDEKEIRERAAYVLINGVPPLVVNARADGRYRLLSGGVDFLAAKRAGIAEVPVRAYRFSDREAEIFVIVEKLKTDSLGAMESAYLMKRLLSEFGWTQDDIAKRIGKSRPAVANTLRLLTLSPEVVGLVESGRLSAGHARALVSVPREKQYAFAEEAIKRDYSVRETERAVKAFLTPPEVLQSEKAAAAAAKSAELKAFVERMRSVFRTKVSLIGNDKKGRIYIDYYSAEDLYRFEEMLDMIESFDRGD